MILEFPVRSNWLIITLHTNAADYSQIELHPSQVDPPPQYCMYNSNTFRTCGKDSPESKTTCKICLHHNLSQSYLNICALDNI